MRSAPANLFSIKATPHNDGCYFQQPQLLPFSCFSLIVGIKVLFEEWREEAANAFSSLERSFQHFCDDIEYSFLKVLLHSTSVLFGTEERLKSHPQTLQLLLTVNYLQTTSNLNSCKDNNVFELK